jgi:hypothetical protein
MGEAKRRKLAGTYPIQNPSTPTDTLDGGFTGFNSHLRRLLPTISDRDIGLAWMRAEGTGAGAARSIPHGRPEAYPVQQDHVVMHVIFGSATLNGAFPVAALDELIAHWKRNPIKRQQLRDAIIHAMARNEHLEEKCGETVMHAAFALAFTGDSGDMLRRAADDGFLRLAYAIESYIDPSGRKAFNFRLTGSDQRRPPEIIPLAAAPPTVAPVEES